MMTLLKTVGFLLTSLTMSIAMAANIHLADPIPELIGDSNITVKFQTISTGLVSPIGGATAPGDSKHIYVTDQNGKIWAIELPVGNNPAKMKLFLNLSNHLVELQESYDERGLLGLAFHPDYQSNGLFYTYISSPARPNTKSDFSTLPSGRNSDHRSVITEWRVDNPSQFPGTVNRKAARVLMRFDQPDFNHNGGALAFGPDKMLYIATGDGGGANDSGLGHAAIGNGQSLAAKNILGKILRIDPLGKNSANRKYGIPKDNPFINKAGADEIFAYGFRNPFRFSFDTVTGKLWVGDVGQKDIEEIDIVTKGSNYGWPIKEGTFKFDKAQGFVYANSPNKPAGLIDPFAQYDHIDGIGQPEKRVAIIGGFAYHGRKINALQDNYVFGDYSGEEGGVSGHLFVLDGNNVKELKITGQNPLKLAVLGWVQDTAGELYLLANSTGNLTGKTGVVLKLVSN